MLKCDISIFLRCVALCMAWHSFSGTALATHWNVSAEVPPGVYEGAPSDIIYLYGGVALATGVPETKDSLPIQGTFAEGSEVSNVRINVANATLSAKGCRFINCTFMPDRKGSVILDSCVLDGCHFFGQSPGKMDQWNGEADKFTLVLRNCVVFAKKAGPETTPVSMSIDDPKKFVFQFESSTFLGRTHLINIRQAEDGFIDSARGAGSYLRSCVMREGHLPLLVLPLTDKCDFDGVRFGGNSSDIKSKHLVMARIRPMDELSRLRKYCPDLRIVSPEAEIAGSSIKNDGNENAELVVVGGTSRALAGAIPQYKPAEDSSAQMPVAQAPPAMNDGIITGTSGAAGIALKSTEARVYSLAVLRPFSGQPERGNVGIASKMSAITREVDKSVPAQVVFMYSAGEIELKGLAEVAKCLQLRHRGWPKGYQIELSPGAAAAAKDNRSMAVACALLLNSLITGKEIDPDFAVAGDMNSDGSVQPVGGVVTMLRGVGKSPCKVVAIPTKNGNSLGDLLLTEGPALFAGIQIYSIDSFDEAEALASADKAAATQSAISEMAKVQEVLLKDKAQLAGWLRNQHVIARLQAILQAAPNHVSARYLLMFATGKMPRT